MHINLFNSSKAITTPWWVLLLLTFFSALINFGLVLGITQLRISQPAWATPLLQLAKQFNPDQKLAEQPFALREFFYKWDSYYYVTIAENGYEKQPFDAYKRHNWAFFPLYPALIRTLAAATTLPRSPELLLAIGIAVSNLFFFCGLLVWKRLATQLKLTESQWWIFVVTLLFFPLSYVFHFVFTESLFFFLSSLALLQISTHRYLSAAWIIGLASITRITGIFLLPLLLIFYWWNHARYKSIWKEISYLAGMSIVAITPLWLYLAYLGSITGEFLAPLKIQSAWDNSNSLPFATFIGYFNDYGLTFSADHGLSIVLLVLCWLLLIGQAFKIKKMVPASAKIHWLLWAFSIILLLVNSSINNRSSIFRYTVTIPYIFVALSMISSTTRKWLAIIPLWIISLCLHVVFLSFFLLQIPLYGF
jgi:Gpi18-like mannosyltransferase